MSDWLTYSPISGHGNGTITLTAQTLTDLQNRIDTVIAKNNVYDISASTTVYQNVPPTSVTFDTFSVMWVNDVPASGGTASKSNCNYKVYANYSDGSQLDITDVADISGELAVPATSNEYRHIAGVLSLTATFDGKTQVIDVDAYQKGLSSKENYENEYLSILALGSGITRFNYSSELSPFRYKINDGVWVSNNSTPLSSVTINNGDIVSFKATNETYYKEIYVEPGHYSVIHASIVNTMPVEVFGNAMSIICGDSFTSATTITGKGALFGLFQQGSYVVSAENLVLPATTLSQYCYNSMFENCTSLIKPPKELPAATVPSFAYQSMFYGCSNMIQMPEIKATNLADDGGGGHNCSTMFRFCTSLTTVKQMSFNYVNENGCYLMFGNCSGLTTVLNITVVNYDGYANFAYMFQLCPNLNNIKFIANYSGGGQTPWKDWLYGVAETGTFVRLSGSNIPVPNNWTIIDINP